ALDPLPLPVRELPRDEGPARRRRTWRGQDGLVAPDLEQQARMFPALEPVPDVAIGPYSGTAHAALEHGQGLELRAGERDPVQVVAAVAELEQEERAAVRPPVGDLRHSIPRQRDVLDVAGFDIPDRRGALAAALVADREPRIARDRRPAERTESEA